MSQALSFLDCRFETFEADGWRFASGSANLLLHKPSFRYTGIRWNLSLLRIVLLIYNSMM
jgi:hypothetical protein